MRQKMSKLFGALAILAIASLGALTPKNVEALTCRQVLEECSSQCNPEDWGCYDLCQCKFLNCRGFQCN